MSRSLDTSDALAVLLNHGVSLALALLAISGLSVSTGSGCLRQARGVLLSVLYLLLDVYIGDVLGWVWIWGGG